MIEQIIPEIEGLDAKKGIAMVGGTAKKYLNVLSVFYQDGTTKIKDINACLEAGDIKSYTVHVHALKSAAAFIGAVSLPQAAKALEDAGKAGELDFINSHNPAFLIELEALLKNINVLLAKEMQEKQNVDIDKNLLINELSQLKEALTTFNLGNIKDTVNFLQDLTNAPDIGDSIEAILHNKLIGEYDEAVNIIETLIAKLKNDA